MYSSRKIYSSIEDVLLVEEMYFCLESLFFNRGCISIQDVCFYLENIFLNRKCTCVQEMYFSIEMYLCLGDTFIFRKCICLTGDNAFLK